MDGDEPLGGRWNYDTENRGAFDKKGPQIIPAPPKFEPDSITQGALADVETYFASHPGSLAHFNWPVTRAEALLALKLFIDTRLEKYGESWQMPHPGVMTCAPDSTSCSIKPETGPL